MASALELNAQATIIGGHGLVTSPDVLAAITSYQNLPTVTLIAKIFNDATTANANIRGNLWEALDTVGSGVTKGQFLIDFYPSNASINNSTGTIHAYHVEVTPIYDENPAHWTTVTDENGTTTTKPIIGYNHIPTMSTASVSQNLLAQANLPFSNGMAGFGNVYVRSYAWVNQVLDTVSSIHLLKDKTYADSGIGYSSPADIVTNGIGNNGPLLASVVENWGTMYDVTKIGTFYDPYVFGENLLLQGFGQYGSLDSKLLAAGLNLAQLSKIPASVTTTALSASTQKVAAPFVGQLDLPTVAVKTTSTPVTGSSPAVIHGIYKTITRTDLNAIVTGTNISIGHQMTTLDDYLDFDKVVDPVLRVELEQIGITDFPSLAKLLNKAVGSGYYADWKALAKLLRSIEAPVLKYTSVSADHTVLTASTISTLSADTGVGTGPFDNPTMPDMLGACGGIPYTASFNRIVDEYPNFSRTIEPALSNLDAAVTYYLTHYTTTTPSDPDSGSTITPAPLGPVTNAVTALNDALNALPDSKLLTEIQSLYFDICTHLYNEFLNLQTAGIVFNSSNSDVLKQFSKSVLNFATNDDTLLSKQLFGNLIANDAYGDTIRAAVSEKNNGILLGSAGIESHNDPQPGLSAMIAKSQNIPIKDYIKRII